MAKKPERREVRRLIAFERETHQALHQLALDRSATLQDLADEAFADLLRKHRRPVGLREMLSQSVRSLPSNDAGAPRRRPRK